MKRTLFYLLEDPTSSSSAFLIHIFTTSLIIISALITILETLPPFNHNTPSHVWFGLETALVVCFTVEYACRAYAHSDTWKMFWKWVGSFFAIIDLLAVAPYYIELALQADTVSPHL